MLPPAGDGGWEGAWMAGPCIKSHPSGAKQVADFPIFSFQLFLGAKQSSEENLRLKALWLSPLLIKVSLMIITPTITRLNTPGLKGATGREIVHSSHLISFSLFTE